MTFSLKMNNGRLLKGIIETLSSIIDETEIFVTPKEFTISAMDPSRICLLKLTMKKTAFETFKCSKKSKVGVNLDDLNKILNRCNQKDSILLSFDENNQKIKIQMDNEKSRKRTFSLALLDIETEEIPMDNLLKIEYPSKWVIEPEFLVEAIKDAEIYSEIISIIATEGKGLEFSSSGQIGEMTYDLAEDELIESDIKDISTGAYSTAFLKSILKLSSITDKLEMSLKTDHPVHIHFELDNGDLDYFLAPRVEEEPFEDDDEYDDDF